MVKRMISLLLSLVLLAGMTAVVPTVGAAETQSEQTGASGTTGSCTWSLSGTVLTISGNGRMKDYNVSYGTKPPWGTNITQVIVNYGVTYIGEDAFYGCENLTEVHLADGTLTEIGESAFAMCKNLEEIVIPDSVETIQSYVFGYCFALKEVTLSKNLSFLGFDAFLRCHALEHIELPDSITSLAGEVFYMCTALKSVRLPAHLDSICSGAFQSCAALESLVLPDTLTIIQSTAFRGCTKLAAINIPSGVTDFGASVFEGTAWLKNQPEGGLYINNCLLDYVGENLRCYESADAAKGGHPAQRHRDPQQRVLRLHRLDRLRYSRQCDKDRQPLAGEYRVAEPAARRHSDGGRHFVSVQGLSALCESGCESRRSRRVRRQ